jgi:Mrp family chromosome partitioning ATPase/uncharacterized protein involved in exopolysaccharide biosynthesis
VGDFADALRRAELDHTSGARSAPGRAAGPEGDGRRPRDPDEEFDDGPWPESVPVERTREPDAEPAEILRWRKGPWAARAVVVEPAGAVADCLRDFALRVERELERRGTRSVLVTSARRGEGRTTVACNLALALATRTPDRKVALLELDLRRPALARGLGVKPAVGFERVLAGEASLYTARVRTDVPSLDLFLADAPGPRTPELLATSALRELVRELADRYDVVVCDSAPVLSASDTLLVASQFGAWVAVARAGSTEQAAFRDMLELLPRETFIGGFVNAVRPSGYADESVYYRARDAEQPHAAAGGARTGRERPPRRAGRRWLGAPVGLLRRRWPWMSPTLLAGLFATAVLVAQVETRYRAQATVRWASSDAAVHALGPGRPSLGDVAPDLLSRETLLELIESHDLYPALRSSGRRDDAVARAFHDVAVTPVAGAGSSQGEQLLRIAYEGDGPDVAAEVANDLARRVSAKRVGLGVDQAGATAASAREDLADAERALRAQAGRIADFKESHRGELPEDLEANLVALEQLEEERQALALRIAEEETRRAMLSTGDYAAPAARLVALRSRLESELAEGGPGHPDVAALRRQVEELEAQVGNAGPVTGSAETATALVVPSERTLRELRSQLAATEEKLGDLDARLARTPDRESGLKALEAREQALRTRVETLRDRVQAASTLLLFTGPDAVAPRLTGAAGSARGERFSVVEWAEPPAGPTVNRWRYLVGGVALSLGVSLAFGLLLERFRPVLFSSAQLASASGVSTLGSVPVISSSST